MTILLVIKALTMQWSILKLRGFIVEKLLRPIAVILEIIQSSLEDGAVSFSEWSHRVLCLILARLVFANHRNVLESSTRITKISVVLLSCVTIHSVKIFVNCFHSFVSDILMLIMFLVLYHFDLFFFIFTQTYFILLYINNYQYSLICGVLSVFNFVNLIFWKKGKEEKKEEEFNSLKLNFFEYIISFLLIINRNVYSFLKFFKKYINNNNNI